MDMAEAHAPLVRCPTCGGDCQLEAITYPGERSPGYSFEFVCDGEGCCFFIVNTDGEFQPAPWVEVREYDHGYQVHRKVRWAEVRKTRQSGRFKP